MKTSSNLFKSFFISLVLILSITFFTSMAFAICYLDSDGDGYGDPETQRGCGAPNTVANSDDCDDTDPDINPDLVWYKDADGDDYSDGTYLTQCTQPANHYLAADLTATSGDCDDTDAYINPTTVWYLDADGDGHSDGTSEGPQCSRSANYYYEQELTATSGDCDDSDGDVYPGASEVCGNGIDNDCNGYIDDIKVPADYGTIQAGINAASAAGCNIVLVSNGTYYENIDFDGKAITVKSVNGAASTTIDASGSGSVVTFDSGETSTSVLDGFTITDGAGTYIVSNYYGNGIYCNSSSPTIQNCNITDNDRTYQGSQGGGIFCDSSSPTITNCDITSNTTGAGGGIRCYDYSSPTITDCYIANNSATIGGGIAAQTYSSPTITDCTIDNNFSSLFGGGIHIYGYSSPSITNTIITDNYAGTFGGGILFYGNSEPTITNSLITFNTARKGGGIFAGDTNSPGLIMNCTITANNVSEGGGGIYCNYNSSPIVVNSIFWGNTKNGPASEVELHDGTASIDITYSDIRGGWTGTGNINENPYYVGGGDYHLTSSSNNVVDGGTSTGAPSDDFDGDDRDEYPDMGYDEYIAP